MVAARGAITYCSMARFKGRAPISSEKPFSSRKSCAEASHFTAHSLSLEPAPLEHAVEPSVRMPRIRSRVSWRNTITLSSRF